MCSLTMSRPDNPAERAAGAGGRRPVAELEREIRELAAHIAAATCRWLLLIGEFDARRGWAVDGVKSCAQWLSGSCSVGMEAAREHVRVASRLPGLPLVRKAFGRGELSYCKVRAITRIATADTEAQLVELGRHATGAQLEKVVRGYRRVHRATLEQARSADERRSLSWSWGKDGSLRFEGRLSADDGALLLAALEAVEGPSLTGPAPPEITAETAVGGTPYQRRADALVSLARCGLASRKGKRAGSDPVELVVHVDAETLSADGVCERSELDQVQTLAPEAVRRLGCDAALMRIIERDGQPLSVSRRTRTVPPALRRALRARDHGCQFPGCTHAKFLHAHHIRHWARGGPTKLDNPVQLCSYHHRLVHEGGFIVERAGTRTLRFRRPNGREIPPSRSCKPAAGPDIGQQNRAEGLAIEAEPCTPVSRGDHLDYGIAVEGLFRKPRSPT